MLGRLRHRLTYANLMATMAVFIALGGTSYAAITITSKNVKNNSLTSADVKNRSLLSQDFKAGQLPAGATGPHGPAGPQGPKGDVGTQGEKGEKGAQGEPATRLFAHVKNDGALNYGSGVSATRRVGTGVYSVTFNRSVTQCSPVFTSGWGRPTGSDFNAGPLDAWFYMPSDTEIWVYSYNNSGATTNGSFHIALFC